MGGRDGFCERILDEVETSELPEEQGHESAPLLAHDALEGGHVWSKPSTRTTGRISTA